MGTDVQPQAPLTSGMKSNQEPRESQWIQSTNELARWKDTILLHVHSGCGLESASVTTNVGK